MSPIPLSEWEAHGRELYESQAPQHAVQPHLQTDPSSGTLFTTSLIHKAIQSTKSGKAADRHRLIIEFFKMVNTSAMMSTLAGVFNRLLAEGWFPVTWAEAIAVPLFKAGKLSIPGNYRYIMLNTIFYKIYAKACNILLMPFPNVPGQSWQAGFRKAHSCLHHIFTLRCVVEHHKL